MPAQRKSSHLRAVAGDRKAGESARRAKRVTAPNVRDVKPPRPLPQDAQAVWDRLAPLLHARGLLSDENSGVLWAYAIAEAQNAAAGLAMFGDDGKPLTLIGGARGMVKNPAAQVFRDTAATMRQLAGALHLDELGVGKESDGKQGAGRLLS